MVGLRARLRERGDDDLEATARLGLGVGVAGAVGPNRRGAGYENPVPDPQGSGDPDLWLKRRTGRDALALAQCLDATTLSTRLIDPGRGGRRSLIPPVRLANESAARELVDHRQRLLEGDSAGRRGARLAEQDDDSAMAGVDHVVEGQAQI